jgi:hypothetical protein
VAQPAQGTGTLAFLQASIVNVVVSFAGFANNSQFATDNTVATMNYKKNIGPSLGSFVSTLQAECMVGAQFMGVVTPSNYRGMVTLRRTKYGSQTYQNSSQLVDSGLFDDDTSPQIYLKQSPVPTGTVYDLDAPGVRTGYPGINRYRNDFYEYAVLGDVGSSQKVSNYLYFRAAASCQSTNSGLQVNTDYNPFGDNNFTMGQSLLLTFNLQSQ